MLSQSKKGLESVIQIFGPAAIEIQHCRSSVKRPQIIHKGLIPYHPAKSGIKWPYGRHGQGGV